jgi:glycosyltransferase involved in cell wall biosynthesis
MNKHVVIVSCVFTPEPVVSAQTSFDIAEALAENDYSVTVICPFPSRPKGKDYSEVKNKEEKKNQLNIIRVESFIYSEFDIWGRLRESFSFGFNSSRYLLKNIKNADAIYVNTWPIFGQLLIVLTARFLKIPIYISIQDIYPESILNRLNSVSKSILMPPLKAIDKYITQSAKKVIVISDKMYNFYKNDRKISKDNLELIYNWQDEQSFVNLPTYNNILVKKGISATGFIYMYLGNIGDAAGVELVIEAFDEAKLDNCSLIIAGGGAKKDSCVELTSKLGCKNIFFTSVEDGEVQSLQAIADVLILPTKKGVALSSIPSKMIAYMFSAKPILATLDKDSDSQKALLDAHCGWVGEPENKEWMISLLQETCQMSKKGLEELGANGFKYGIENYSKAQNVSKVINLINNTFKH